MTNILDFGRCFFLRWINFSPKSLFTCTFGANLASFSVEHVVCLLVGTTSQMRTVTEQCASSEKKEEAFMKRRGFQLVVAVLAVCLLASTHAFAQGGGASTTGSINGKVADSSGGVLPGVTVNATSPSSMGVQTSVTDASGNYRFPALPPGTYTVSYELA